MRRQIAALLVALFMVPQLLAGQTLRPGRRVRVSLPSEGTRTGTVVALTADTLEVRLSGRSQSSNVPLAEVTRLDVSRGKERHMRYAGVGLLVGAGLGAVAGFAAGEDECPPHAWFCIDRGQGAALGGAFFGSIGGVLGLVVGVIPTEKWERVPLEPRRVSFDASPAGRGARVGLSVAF